VRLFMAFWWALQMAVESCPVDCIHYVQRSQLPLLEFVMKRCERRVLAGSVEPAVSRSRLRMLLQVTVGAGARHWAV
jgi:hypothetical protein